jgi:hypothetical protein
MDILSGGEPQRQARGVESLAAADTASRFVERILVKNPETWREEAKRVVRAKQVKRPRLFCSIFRPCVAPAMLPEPFTIGCYGLHCCEIASGEEICEIVLLADPTTIDAIMAGPAHRALCRLSENIRVTGGKVALHVAAMQQVHLVQWLAACSCRRQGRAVVRAGAAIRAKALVWGTWRVATTLEKLRVRVSREGYSGQTRLTPPPSGEGGPRTVSLLAR